MANRNLKLTKDQRFVAYCILLKELSMNRRGNKSRYCHLIFKVFGISNDGLEKKWDGGWFLENDSASINRVLDFFPELKSKEPHIGWPEVDKEGIEQRKKWLEQCIAETHP